MRLAVALLLLVLPKVAGAVPPSPPPEAPRVSIERFAGRNIIVISGPIMEETEAAFPLALAQAGARPLVFLDSPGGIIQSGVAIGRLIRARGLQTVVPNRSICFSACGLIWLAGEERWLGEGARVGFHAASTAPPRGRGAGRVSSSGNALVGAYLGQLGLNDFQIGVLTEASPGRMLELNSLRPGQLAELGIAYRRGMPSAPPRPGRISPK
ncbi:hypothetical protein [Roseococcus pinisoli]|uniref:Uncharacterized protein n=1 Tax=Roseococcus pinisoli TaxID=2835040 RepID=A0ABS5QEJ6_9PROT|nr:hypothetical protein [Roseococcus pinisoli]MBS7811327.1 hypothetical protein [Roseococcus pinisoli]